MLAITNAKRVGAKEFVFPGDSQVIGLKRDVAYFITMNPGYQGRQELPENLKVQTGNRAHSNRMGGGVYWKTGALLPRLQSGVAWYFLDSFTVAILLCETFFPVVLLTLPAVCVDFSLLDLRQISRTLARPPPRSYSGRLR